MTIAVSDRALRDSIVFDDRGLIAGGIRLRDPGADREFSGMYRRSRRIGLVRTGGARSVPASGFCQTRCWLSGCLSKYDADGLDHFID